MNTDEAPFYLAVKSCYKKSALSVNTLNSLMKRMAEKAGFDPNIDNHSERKTMQTLTNNDAPPTGIVQLSGHKNSQSVTNYSTLSKSQQMNMSRDLANLATSKDSSTSSISEHKPNREVEQQQQQQEQAIALFSAEVIHRIKKDGDMSILPECIAGIK